jgi:hypothetical protein
MFVSFWRTDLTESKNNIIIGVIYSIHIHV